MSIHTILSQQTWRVIENSQFAPKHAALASFAVDDTLCQSVGRKESPAVARSWIHDQTIVLGIQDSRLPRLRDGIEYLKTDGWNVIVRNSGGLAVVLDEGIYNLSLILHEKDNQLSIDKGFDTMVALLRKLLSPLGIDFQTGEIVGSYCPGSYDLSVDGKKFAGISQRRIRGGVAVQVYLCMTGSGSERAQIIERFYKLAGNGNPDLCPPIYPETMASLTELSSREVRHSHLNDRLSHILSEQSVVIHSDLNEIEAELFELYFKRVVERTNKVFAPLNLA